GSGSVATAANTVSFGSTGQERTLVNVGAGAVSATSTDAVNGAQLYAVQLASGSASAAAAAAQDTADTALANAGLAQSTASAASSSASAAQDTADTALAIDGRAHDASA